MQETQPQNDTEPTPPWRRLHPYAPHYLDLDGPRMHYLDEGDGPPVIMLHGNPSWSFLYRNLVAAVSPHLRTVVPDHIGCGLSDKPQCYPYRLETHIRNLETLLFDHLGLSRFSLVVHDWGGAIGMGVATRHPEAVQRLVVLNTAAFLGGRCPLRIRLCRIPGFGALAVRGGNAFARAAVHMAVCRPLPANVRAGFLAPYGSWHDRIATLRFVEDIPLSPQHPTHATLQAIEAGLEALQDKPMLIAWGMRDFCFTPAYLEEWERRFPQADVVRCPDAGHYVLEDAGHDLLARIRGFLTTTP